MNSSRNFALRNQWANLINGKEVDKSIVGDMVYESWIRSMEAGLNPNNLNEDIYLTEDEVNNYMQCVETQFQENISNVLKKIAEEMKLSIIIYDTNCNVKSILAVPEEVKPYIAKSVSENVVGTNAICLALKHNTPVQLIGEEHFYYKNGNCSAAPINNSEGKIDSIVNIGGFSHTPTLETLGLATSIAQIIENNININNMLTELKTSNTILNNIIDHNSTGIMYLDDNKNIKYNRSLLNMFEIKHINNLQLIVKKLEDIVSQIEDYKHKHEIDSKEIVLNINNKLKSFMVSMKIIKVNDIAKNGYFFSFEDTNKLMRINMKGSRAFYNFDDIIGENEEIKKVKSMAKKAARTQSPILIYGESGTGKEVLAQSIHNESFRKDKPFVAINCGAIPSELIESELFGYEPGAFTGASRSTKIGVLEAVSGGTIFFDEVESMPLNVQIKLLRALSENKISRIGGVEEIPINIRIISASKKDLLMEVEKGNFREDLYFRINVIIINLPPLRERREDIPIIAKHFIKYFINKGNITEMSIDLEFLEALQYYYWRGNVRELRNVIEKAVLLNEDTKLTINNLPPKIMQAYKYKSLKESVYQDIEIIIRDAKTNDNMLMACEELVVEMVLKEEKWNLTNAAKRLGISRTTLYKKINDMPKLKKHKNTYTNSTETEQQPKLHRN